MLASQIVQRYNLVHDTNCNFLNHTSAKYSCGFIFLSVPNTNSNPCPSTECGNSVLFNASRVDSSTSTVSIIGASCLSLECKCSLKLPDIEFINDPVCSPPWSMCTGQ